MNSRYIPGSLLMFSATLYAAFSVLGARAQPEMRPPLPGSGKLPIAAEVVSNYLQALGGTMVLGKLESQNATGTYSNDQFGSETYALEVRKKAPNRWLFTIRAPDGGIFQQGFDGTLGWTQSGQLPREQLAIMARLLSLQSSLHLAGLVPRMKVIGTAKIGTDEAFVVEAPVTAEQVEKLYFDARSGLLLREEIGGGSLIYGDYRTVDGAQVPFSIRQEGSPNWTIRFEAIRHNVPVADSEFERPKGH